MNLFKDNFQLTIIEETVVLVIISNHSLDEREQHGMTFGFQAIFCFADVFKLN